MKALDRHIRNTVLAAMLVVTGVIVVLDLIFSLLDQLADTDANYTTLHALVFVLLTTPTSLYELLPFAALGGALIGLGVLASSNELVAMQAAGIKVSRIVLAVLKPVLVVMLLGLVLGEYVSPPLEQTARSNKAIQQSAVAGVSARGIWQRVGNEFVHINAIAPDGTLLYGVTRYLVDEQRRLLSASFAATASWSGAEGYWRLSGIEESRLAGDSIEVNRYVEQQWRAPLSPQLLSVLLVDPDEQSLSGLYRFARYFDSQGLDGAVYYLAFWKKLLQPAATLALVLLGVSFVFGSLREATMGGRVFAALAIALGFTILQRMMEPTSLLYGFSPLPAVLTPTLICAALGFYQIGRVR